MPIAARLGRWRDVWRRFAGRGVYPHELAWVLLVPMRRWILSPERLVSHLSLAPSARVLELGPGPGYFSAAVARAVPEGRLELADIQHEMLVKARERVQRAGPGNVGYVRASGVALPFADASFDAAFLVTVLGELPDPAVAVRGLARVLKIGGRLSIVEQQGDPDAMTQDELRALTAASGFALEGHVQIRLGFIANFRKVKDRDLEIAPASTGMHLRPARPEEADAISALAFRSKAHWGYSAEFMAACRAELTYAPEAIERGEFVVAHVGGRIAGFTALVRLSDDEIELDAMFVDPLDIGRGYGRMLIEGAVQTAAQRGAKRLVIQADPNAEPFYLSVGARRIGTRESASIPGRQLPLLAVELTRQQGRSS